MTSEWLVDNFSVTQAARVIEGASKSGEAEFARLPDDANIVVFSLLADKSTYCGSVHIQDTAVGRRQRLRITISDDDGTPPPKPGGLGGMFAKKAAYARRQDVVDRAIANLKVALPPI
ncbi:MAG: hypothetical protein EPO26_03670 [Chloroflexota bacterium]|nr:MAG: hypothetical protein EPO26_03670 [Chloroflexota bacterium]